MQNSSWYTVFNAADDVSPVVGLSFGTGAAKENFESTVLAISRKPEAGAGMGNDEAADDD